MGEIAGGDQTGIINHRRNTGKTAVTKEDRSNPAAGYVILQNYSPSECDKH